jgi:exonuclease III
MTNWRGHGSTIISTWNVRGINGKELVKEIKETKVKYLVLTETKKKGQGVEELDEDFLLFYNGVPKNERARAGVGCLLHKRKD